MDLEHRTPHGNKFFGVIYMSELYSLAGISLQPSNVVPEECWCFTFFFNNCILVHLCGAVVPSEITQLVVRTNCVNSEWTTCVRMYVNIFKRLTNFSTAGNLAYFLAQDSIFFSAIRSVPLIPYLFRLIFLVMISLSAYAMQHWHNATANCSTVSFP